MGILLLICTVISLLLSNMGLTKDLYASFWKQSFSGLPSDHYYTIHFLSLPNSLMVVINDLLMAVFFFLAGMEIRREIHHGELSSFKKS
ncbi:Na+/H+ antiporter NhaA, partial [Acinetobacter baumannii]